MCCVGVCCYNHHNNTPFLPITTCFLVRGEGVVVVMEGVLSSFETLAVRGEEGVSWDKAAAVLAIRGGILYDSAIIRLTAKLDYNLLVLNRHVALDNFTVDAVAVGGEEEEQDGGGGVLNFIQERIVGSKKSSKIKDSSEAAVMGAWEACRAKGYHGLHVLAKVTQASMPEPSKHRYTPGHYVEALLNGFRAYYKFQRHDPLFEEDALGLWGAGGGGCVEPVTVCYLVLAWRMAQRNTGELCAPVITYSITDTCASVTGDILYLHQNVVRIHQVLYKCNQSIMVNVFL